MAPLVIRRAANGSNHMTVRSAPNDTATASANCGWIRPGLQFFGRSPRAMVGCSSDSKLAHSRPRSGEATATSPTSNVAASFTSVPSKPCRTNRLAQSAPLCTTNGHHPTIPPHFPSSVALLECHDSYPASETRATNATANCYGSHDCRARGTLRRPGTTVLLTGCLIHARCPADIHSVG
jgi:hypothetical protein